MEYENDFKTRNDLDRFGNEKLSLYALEKRFSIEDIEWVGDNSITDGSDDKKMDIVYLNPEAKRAVIIQSYFATEKLDGQAKVNKASDLNTACTWCFSMPDNDLPERVKSHVLEFRNGLINNEYKEIYLWYVHNKNESDEVKNELEGVKNTAKAFLSQKFPDIKDVRIFAQEIGKKAINEFYLEKNTPINVTETIELEQTKGLKIDSTTANNWESVVTSIAGTKLKELYSTHGLKLFSANVREYLGYIKTDVNINYGIKQTATESPDDFWIYNNGVTALTNEIIIDEENSKIIMQGMSIVNGAQTTGALSENESISNSLKVPLRIIKCKDEDTIMRLIRYNNSQNRINPSDFRSGDKYQKKLSEEFDAFDDCIYIRKRSFSNKIIRGKHSINLETCSQLLMAFMYSAEIAYHEKRKIVEEDEKYSRIFNDKTNAPFIRLIYSLYRSLNNQKQELYIKDRNDQLTKHEESIASYFRIRGSMVLLIHAIGNSFESILNEKIDDLLELKVAKVMSIDQMIEEWNKVLPAILPFAKHLSSGIDSGLKNKEKISSALSSFNDMIIATRPTNAGIFDKFKEAVFI